MPNRTNNNDAREECYANLRAIMKEGISRYYEQHPERLDKRALDAIEFSTAGLQRMFQVLDDYDIHYRVRNDKTDGGHFEGS